MTWARPIRILSTSSNITAKQCTFIAVLESSIYSSNSSEKTVQSWCILGLKFRFVWTSVCFDLFASFFDLWRRRLFDNYNDPKFRFMVVTHRMRRSPWRPVSFPRECPRPPCWWHWPTRSKPLPPRRLSWHTRTELASTPHTQRPFSGKTTWFNIKNPILISDFIFNINYFSQL